MVGWEGNIEMNFKGTGSQVVYWICMAHGRGQGRGDENVRVNIPVSQKVVSKRKRTISGRGGWLLGYKYLFRVPCQSFHN